MTAVAVRSFANLAEFSTDELKKELGHALEITADNLVYLARLWRELESRGEDLSELRSGLRTFLPLIADGRLDAQAAVQFAGNLTALRALATLPIATQRRLTAGQRIEVAMTKEGQPIVRSLRVDEISSRMIKQVFAVGRVRTAEEQQAMFTISGQRAPTPRKTLKLSLEPSTIQTWRKEAARQNMTLSEFVERAVSKELSP